MASGLQMVHESGQDRGFTCNFGVSTLEPRTEFSRVSGRGRALGLRNLRSGSGLQAGQTPA